MWGGNKFWNKKFNIKILVLVILFFFVKMEVIWLW